VPNYLYRVTVATGIVTSARLSLLVATGVLTSQCPSLLINARRYYGLRPIAANLKKSEISEQIDPFNIYYTIH
jgi:hypothetical protein